MGTARVRMPASAKRGEVIEIRTLVQHPMESGFRLDNTGREIARHIIESLHCTYNGREFFAPGCIPPFPPTHSLRFMPSPRKAAISFSPGRTIRGVTQSLTVV